MKPFFDGYFSLLAALYAAEQYLPLLFLKQKKREKTKTYPPLSIIIPVKNEGLVIEKTLNSWLKINYPDKIEILICDSGSTDKTAPIVEKIASLHKNIKYYRTYTNNKLNTLMEGIKKAQYQYLVISDADRPPRENALLELVPYLNQEIGAVFGMGQVTNNDKPFQKIMTLEFLNIMLEMLFYSNIDSEPYLYLHTCIIKKDLIANLKPQNLIADDLYFAINIRKQGYKAIFIPQVITGEEQVIDFPDLLKKRLRTSQGTIEIAKSNYLGMAFNSQYGLFSLFLLPFRQITTVGTNLLTFFSLILTILAVILQKISFFYLIKVLLFIYFAVLIGQILRYFMYKNIFPENAKTVPIWAIILYPIYYLSIRKLLAGYTFLTALLGIKYSWSRSTTDRT